MNVGEILSIKYLGSKVTEELEEVAFKAMLEANMADIVDSVARQLHPQLWPAGRKCRSATKFLNGDIVSNRKAYLKYYYHAVNSIKPSTEAQEQYYGEIIYALSDAESSKDDDKIKTYFDRVDKILKDVFCIKVALPE